MVITSCLHNLLHDCGLCFAKMCLHHDTICHVGALQWCSVFGIFFSHTRTTEASVWNSLRSDTSCWIQQLSVRRENTPFVKCLSEKTSTAAAAAASFFQGIFSYFYSRLSTCELRDVCFCRVWRHLSPVIDARLVFFIYLIKQPCFVRCQNSLKMIYCQCSVCRLFGTFLLFMFFNWKQLSDLCVMDQGNFLDLQHWEP